MLYLSVLADVVYEDSDKRVQGVYWKRYSVPSEDGNS